MVNARDELLYAMVKLIRNFVEYRHRYGGIALSNTQIIRETFQEALYETCVEERPKPPTEIPIIGRKP